MSETRRTFSKSLQSANRRYLSDDIPTRSTRVGFVLLENFSMMTFTAAVDSLVTANLVGHQRAFTHSTFALGETRVRSDLGIDLQAQGSVNRIEVDRDGRGLDVLIVVGGYRATLNHSPVLLEKLQAADQQGVILGGLWNGALALVQAGVMDGRPCALHPDNHALLREKYPQVRLSDQTFALDSERITSAGPASTLEAMLSFIERERGRDLARAIREILAADQLSVTDSPASSMLQDDPSLPEALRSLIQLMRSNIEEPLSSEELASCVNLSRRQVERLFQTHLAASPSRYYFELRLTQAHRLLVQTSDSITRVSLACGFVSSSHFSNCFKDFFGESPSVARQRHRASKAN